MAGLPRLYREEERAETPLFSVTELTALVKETLETGFADVGVRGEISNLARPRSGHVYFQLKDDGAQCRSVLWKTQAQRLVFELTDGLAVRAWGALTVYPPRGEYQLTVRAIEPEGIGPLELALRQTVERLKAEGLFDIARKRPLPRYPRRIVIVTSPTGAVIRDILQIVGRRWPGVEILLAPVRVQGPGAAEEVAAAIGLANQVAAVDYLIVARGGGSLEDLWAFNEEIVARAIFASARPVVSAIGHEVDTTIADLVADLRAPTPSAAAELCVPELMEVRATIDQLAARLARGASHPVNQARLKLTALADRLHRAGRLGGERRREALMRLAAQLEALGPLAVLSRGYSLTQRADVDRLLRSAADAPAGTLIRTRLAAGTLLSRVEEALLPHTG
jgi:exodeoxyribonuclease VII large subunit